MEVNYLQLNLHSEDSKDKLNRVLLKPYSQLFTALPQKTFYSPTIHRQPTSPSWEGYETVSASIMSQHISKAASVEAHPRDPDL